MTVEVHTATRRSGRLGPVQSLAARKEAEYEAHFARGEGDRVRRKLLEDAVLWSRRGAMQLVSDLVHAAVGAAMDREDFEWCEALLREVRASDISPEVAVLIAIAADPLRRKLAAPWDEYLRWLEARLPAQGWSPAEVARTMTRLRRP